MKRDLNLWPYGIIGSFVLLFCGIATAVTIACTHRDGLVSENYYEQELNFQERIDAAARAQTSGAALDFNPAQGMLTVTLPAGQRNQPVSGSVHFYRPSAPELDRELTLQPRPDGVQILDVSHLAPGNWSVRVAWQSGGQDYYLTQKIVVASR